MCHIRLLDFKRWTGHAEQSQHCLSAFSEEEECKINRRLFLKNAMDLEWETVKLIGSATFPKVKYFGTQYLKVQKWPQKTISEESSGLDCGGRDGE